jgi:hypothetical protein
MCCVLTLRIFIFNFDHFICILGGTYGYRGPGSDYGDHGNGRRVSGSWYGDSGDDASETSSICSERAVEVSF